MNPEEMSSSNSFNVTSSSSGVAAPAHGSSGTFERTSADTSGGGLLDPANHGAGRVPSHTILISVVPLLW